MANEKRLVNAEAIARKLKNAYCAECNVVRQIQCSACWVSDVLELLDGDSVDAVEVVRCKDCRWFNKRGYEEDNEHEEDSALHMGFCLRWRRGTQACRFCSYGERREGE